VRLLARLLKEKGKGESPPLSSMIVERFLAESSLLFFVVVIYVVGEESESESEKRSETEMTEARIRIGVSTVPSRP